MKKIGFAKRSRFLSNAGRLAQILPDIAKILVDLLPVLLDAGGAQPGKAMLIDGKLPGKEFVDRQRVAAASLLEGEQAAANRGNDFGLTADNPPFGPGRGQIRNC
jgi:hypothetical protein